MPRVVTKFRCTECLDEFEATSDDFSECSCGKCWVRPSEYSTSYKHKTPEARGVYFEQLESKIFRFQNEYHVPEPEFFAIWNSIKELKDNIGYGHPSMFVYEREDNSADGNKFLANLKAEIYDTNNYHEATYLKFDVDLRNNLNAEELLSRLKSFYELTLKIVNKEVDINNREQMKKHADNWYRDQCELYDYTFYT